MHNFNHGGSTTDPSNLLRSDQSASQPITSSMPMALRPEYISLSLVSGANGRDSTNHSDAYIRNWTLIFSQGPSRDDKIAALQHFVALMEIYYTPTLATFGLATNVLLVSLAARGRMKLLSVTPFIFILALADSSYLTAQLILWLDKTQATEIQVMPGMCQVIKFLVFVGNFLSIWFVICIQVDRYISMWYISRRPQPANVRRSTFIACFIGLLGLLLYSCVIWISGHGPSFEDSKACIFLPKYYDVLRIFIKADTIIAVLLPYSMLPILNLLVLIQVLIKAATIRRRRPSNGDCRTRHVDYVGRIRKQVQCTASFLAITSIVWVLAMPAQVMRMATFFTFEPLKTMSQRDQVYHQICSYPFSLSLAIKFMLYLTFSVIFRDAVLECCRWCDCRPTSSITTGSTSGHCQMSPIPSMANSPSRSPQPSPTIQNIVSKI